MSDNPREALARSLAQTRRGVTARVNDNDRSQADAILAEYLVIPRTDITTEYGWREKAPMHPHMIATREAALLAAQEERRRQSACGAEPTAQAVERPPWSPIPLPEAGEAR